MLFEISSPKNLGCLKSYFIPLEMNKILCYGNKRGYIQAHATNQIALVIYFYWMIWDWDVIAFLLIRQVLKSGHTYDKTSYIFKM